MTGWPLVGYATLPSRMRTLQLALAFSALAALGCPPPSPEVSPATPRRGPRVQSFTESAAVTTVVAVPPYVVTGSTRGVDRYDLRGGARSHLGPEDGLPLDPIAALAPHSDGRRVWVGARSGIVILDPEKGTLDALPPPSPELPPLLSALRAIVSDPDTDGLWVGTTLGLFHADPEAGWRHVGYTQPVDALFRGTDGGLYLGGPSGLVLRRPDGSYDTIDAEDGCAVARVAFVLPAPDGQPIVVGEDAKGRPRLAFLLGDRWVTFRPSPEVRFVGGARRLDEVILATSDRLFALSPPRGGARVLRRDGMRLVSVTGSQRSPYAIRPVDLSLPPEPTAVASAGGEVFVGTRTVGTARLALDGRARPRWLRRRDLVDGAQDLSVACAAREECFVATGAARTWRYDGKGFAEQSLVDEEAIVLAVVRSPEGHVLALYRLAHEWRLRVARHVGKGFDPVAALSIETPGGIAALKFAKFSPDGLLWLGLEYRDADGEPRPFGVATVDLNLNIVTYHRQVEDDEKRRAGVLPIPNDVADIAFLSDPSRQELEVWFATASGAARVLLPGEKLTVFTEAEGLESEILHGIAATGGGVVFVASSRGIGQFDGQRWTFPRGLAVTANAVALGLDGRLWIGTDRGLVAFDGRRVERIGARAGLLAEEIDDVAVDHFGRVWTRSAQGVTIVVP